MPSSEQIAYAAGIFDGEGSLAVYIGAGPNRTSMVYCCSVWQSRYNLLEWLFEHFEGGVYGRKGSGYGVNSRKTAGEWRVTGIKAYNFLVAILPYLIVRKDDVQEMIKIWETRSNHEQRNELISQRKERLTNGRTT